MTVARDRWDRQLGSTGDVGHTVGQREWQEILELLGVRQRNFHLIPLALSIQGREEGEEDMMEEVVWAPQKGGFSQLTKRPEDQLKGYSKPGVRRRKHGFHQWQEKWRGRSKQKESSIGIKERMDTEVEIGESKVTSSFTLEGQVQQQLGTNGVVGKATTLWNMVGHGISNSPVCTGRHLQIEPFRKMILSHRHRGYG